MNDNKTPECADLIAALRTAANGGLILTGKAAGVIVNPRCLEYAADLLEQLISLQSDNAELKQRVEAKEAILRLYEPTLSLVASDKDAAIYRMRKAEAALSRVEAERDAAIADIKIAASGRCCQICGQDCAGYEEISACTAFEWRGAQGEG